VPSEQPGRLFGFVLTAIVVGILTGLMAGSFRLALDWLTWVRRQLLVQAQGNPIPGLLGAVVVCGAAAAGRRRWSTASNHTRRAAASLGSRLSWREGPSPGALGSCR